MKKLVVLASALFAVACSETPTQATSDAPELLAAAKSDNAAVVEHIKIDDDGCFSFDPWVFCSQITGMIHQTTTRSGVVSFRGDLKVHMQSYLDGELFGSAYQELSQHALVKKGDLVQLHDVGCYTSSDGSWNFSSLLHVANGQVRREVFSTDGCNA